MITRVTLFLIFVTINLSVWSQTTFFVDQQSGNNSNSGLQSSAAFADFDSAKDLVQPGDTIKIMGVYHNPSYNPNFQFTSAHDPALWHQENSISITNVHGAMGAPITITSFDENTVLKGDGANIFRVQNSSYLRIVDLEIFGEVPQIPLSTAHALQFVYLEADNVIDPKNPLPSELIYRDQECVQNCIPDSVAEGEKYRNISNISVKRPSYIDTRGLYLSNVTNIEISGNIVHDMPGGGIRVADCEDILISNNEVYACSRKSYSGTHALVVTKATSSRAGDDYRIRILRNRVHHNYNEQFSWSPGKTVITPHIDEGKGISLQRNETTFDSHGAIKINWENGRILVQNNVCYFNGFSGVHSNDGNRIDFINNTCFFNSYTKSITLGTPSNNGGNIGISAQGGSDIRILNNISVIDAQQNKSAISSNISSEEGLVVAHNLIYGYKLNGEFEEINENGNVRDLQEDRIMEHPEFVDVDIFDFRLRNNSPAIDRANPNFAPEKDYNEALRGAMPDLGAFEFQSEVSVFSIAETEVINIFPNPAKNWLYIAGVPEENIHFTVLNTLGQDVSSHVRRMGSRLNVSRLPDGYYTMIIGNSSVPFIVLK